MIRGVVDAVPEARVAVAARLGLLQDQQREPYRAKIDKEFTGRYGIGNWDFGRCLAAVNAYEKASSDPVGTLDLLLYTLEEAVSVADMGDEVFHRKLVRVVDRTTDVCGKHPRAARAAADRARRAVAALVEMPYGLEDAALDLEVALDDAEEDD